MGKKREIWGEGKVGRARGDGGVSRHGVGDTDQQAVAFLFAAGLKFFSLFSQKTQVALERLLEGKK